MGSKLGEFKYPETYILYRELEAKRVDLNLPYYFAKEVQNVAEDLDAEIYADVWWPYLYITLIRDIQKEAERCTEEEFESDKEHNEHYCRDICEGELHCAEACMDDIRVRIYRSCEEYIADDLRPKFFEAARKIEREAEVYGIIAKTHVYFDNEGVKLKVRLEGYMPVIPIDVGKTLVANLAKSTMTPYYADWEGLARDVVKALMRFFGINKLIALAHTLDKDSVKITRVIDSYDNLRRYEMTIEHEDDKITLLVTEEKGELHWLIKKIEVVKLEGKVADLTPA